MRQYLRFALVVLSALLLGRLIVIMIARPESREWWSLGYWEEAAKIGHVMRIVNTHYVDEEHSDYDTLSVNALDAMLQNLDRYSDFLDPSEFAEFETNTDQHYAGIGVEIERLNRRVTVTEVFSNSPASEVGIEPGDQIFAVGEKDTRDFTLRQIVELIRGPVGSEVPVTIYRPSDGQEHTYELTRNEVEFPTLRDVELSPDGIGYMRLTQFSRRSGEEISSALASLEERGMRALILDLRNNPGGLLPVSVDIAGEFVAKGTAIVSTRGRKGEIERFEYTRKEPHSVEYPLVVLVNSYSASASEIVSGALQDLGRAVIVGERTVGKGSVQSIIYLDKDEAVRLTTARYYLPSGRTISEVGVEPDIIVEETSEERLQILAQRAYRDMPADKFEALFGIKLQPDRQRDTAEDILRGVLTFEASLGAKL